MTIISSGWPTFIEDLGYFGMEIRRQPSTGWGVVAGMSLPDVQLSDLPGLKDLAALEKVVDLKELSLFIAGYDGAQLQFPGLEKFGNPTLVGHNIPVTPGTGGLIAGVNASATLAFGHQPQGDGAAQDHPRPQPRDGSRHSGVARAIGKLAPIFPL